jgi:hypothetical protein
MANDEHLIRAGSKLFKIAPCSKARTPPYTEMGKMPPTLVPLVGTR